MNITWKIDNLEWNQETGLLVLAYWTVTASEGKLSASYSGTARFPDDPDSFGVVPMEDLDENKAIALVRSNLSDVFSIESFVIGEVEKQKKSEELVSGLPW